MSTNDPFATCMVCGDDLEQWSEKDENTGDRKFWEKCPTCDKKWTTGTVTRAEYEALAGIAQPMLKENKPMPLDTPGDEPIVKRAAAKQLKKVNDLLMRRGSWNRKRKSGKRR